MMWKVLIIILIILVIILVALYYFGNKMQKKQAENQAQLDAMAQTVSMLIIDKKRLRVKDSGLPAMVIDQVPKYLRRSKMPIVKAKVGPKVMNLIADEKVFELLPVKKEVKASSAASTSPPSRVQEAESRNRNRRKDFSNGCFINKIHFENVQIPCPSLQF